MVYIVKRYTIAKLLHGVKLELRNILKIVDCGVHFELKCKSQTKDIKEISGLLQKVDDLKRLFLLYDHQLESRYINFRAPEDDPTSTMETINFKRRKKRIPSFSLIAYSGHLFRQSSKALTSVFWKLDRMPQHFLFSDLQYFPN
ncbi:uncharacterized protein BX663DRAFT_487469 [Cokeromyces recurvatus]|uniref:uncharacterized protein n=1 Tax=Cokeromyces recurvatus TaxID=90255 RepID=UPI00221FFC89|nr:uncharacterized protein BX663DRAFT_487469 [Cokeromyces recurvatus]KAI7901289.1 hypothetical protein BX663DRAFT_487469 [Cokeromyces recurvatus]